MAFSFWHCRFGREVWGVLQLARNWRGCGAELAHTQPFPPFCVSRTELS